MAKAKRAADLFSISEGIIDINQATFLANLTSLRELFKTRSFCGRTQADQDVDEIADFTAASIARILAVVGRIFYVRDHSSSVEDDVNSLHDLQLLLRESAQLEKGYLYLSQHRNKLGTSVSKLIEAAVRKRCIKVGKHDNEVVHAYESR